MKRKPRPAKAGHVEVKVEGNKLLVVVQGVVAELTPLQARRIGYKAVEGAEYLLERAT